MPHARERMVIKGSPYWKRESAWEDMPMSHDTRGGGGTEGRLGQGSELRGGNGKGLGERQMGVALRLLLKQVTFHLLIYKTG